ncbi:DNA-directed RNA polymerase subunit delta [Oceanobacillus sp. FSL K6-2867]|uniref:DNA-directed RNA polymerase subunit delta n=1 Tax=Oceanobacillus sp. FSL K6-2867 TaxID=2954748 RepID=UPI0030D85807
MSLDKYSHEELQEMSMIELASKILFDEKKALNFRDIFDKIAEIKGFSDSEKENNIAQFYTDMNVDGRFLTLGSSMWGLKRWYPVEQAQEELTEIPKKKRVKKKTEEEVEEVDDELDITDEDIDEIVEDFTDDDDFDEDFDEEELDDEELVIEEDDIDEEK